MRYVSVGRRAVDVLDNTIDAVGANAGKALKRRWCKAANKGTRERRREGSGRHRALPNTVPANGNAALHHDEKGGNINESHAQGEPRSRRAWR